jgi:mannosyltransferase OCH1-like enzyme
MILILILLIFIIFIIVNFRLPRSEYFTSTSIPHVIVSTYSDKKEIPQKVYDNIKKYAQNYKYKIYDDQEIIQFLKKYYPPNVIQAFYSLDKGAHKADLFRYCNLEVFI